MAHINKETLQFLKELKENNDKEWFAENKPRYVEAQNNMKALAAELSEIISTHDLIEAPKVFRIYRDVRFSKDKTPYKQNLGIGIARATDALRGGMYINIEPGNNFVGGGFWSPNAPDLKRIRYEFSVNAGEFRTILSAPTFIDHFGTIQGSTLKTAPRGFAKDHPDIDLLRMKQFLVMKPFSDAEVKSPNFAADINKTILAMRPFFDFMSDVLTTNENGESIL